MCSRLHAGLLVAVVALAGASSAQAFAFQFGMTTGAVVVDLDDLNSHLSSQGYGEFEGPFQTWGTSVRFKFGGGFVVCLDQEQFSTLNTRTGSVVGALDGNYDINRIGYTVYRSGRLSVAPRLGIGSASMSLDLSDFAANTIARLDARSYVVDLGADIDYVWAQRRFDGGLLLGLRVGYTVPVVEGSWELDADVINDLDGDYHVYPKSAPTGPYAWIVLGASWGN